jgi:AraC-like DNA-binding protein
MEYRSIALPDTSPIERIWMARGDGSSRETILPDGRYELIFNLGDLVTQDGVAQPRSLLAAETRRAVSIEPGRRSDFVGITLRDGAAGSILAVSLRDVRDRMLDLRDVAPRLDIRERLAEAGGEERLAIITEAFRGAADPLAQVAASAIRRSGGRLSISRLALACGVTVRTLSRTFDRALGLTPKTLTRVTRLGRAAALLREGTSAVEAALDAGFFDQSHMTNEFRSMAGLSPSKWLDLPDGLGVRFLQDPAAQSA